MSAMGRKQLFTHHARNTVFDCTVNVGLWPFGSIPGDLGKRF
jgi:hypothetical protein